MALGRVAGDLDVVDLRCDIGSMANDMKYNPAMGQFMAWRRMLSRCYNRRDPGYRYYGERGIEIYSGWTPWGNPDENGFKQFRDDIHAEIGRWPGPGYSLDRIDNDGHYEPGNLRWADAWQQNNNKRPRGMG